MEPQPITIIVKTEYLTEHSIPEQKRFAFSYTITIQNNSDTPTQLLRRHWVITDTNSVIQEVKGDGVIGEQPNILPGDSYTYTSGAILETQAGMMEGSYEMQTAEGKVFSVPIPSFSLTRPQSLH